MNMELASREILANEQELQAFLANVHHAEKDIKL